ncbi:MAG TPA: ATP-binding protein [Burkholderiaceae bacterium]|nr:ATP-binding protein [Burkholderiaceae bacterium]
MRSLRLRLFVFLLALASVAALAVGGATYVSVRGEADELFDYHLRQMALTLRDQGRIPDDERAVLERAEFDYVVQVWSVDGVVLYSTSPAPLLPARAVLGFSNVLVNGAPWRIYAAATPLRIVQVGQPLAVRRALAAAAAGRSVLPIAVAAPIVGLAMWWLVGASLAPLARVVRAVRERDANALEPLPVQGLPSEVTPLIDAFNTLLARLASAFDTQRAFTADAAHELRSPLTALTLQLGLLRDARDDAERNDSLARLSAGIERARHLVEQLLALARAEPGGTSARTRVDLSQVASQAVADTAAQAAAARGRVELQTLPALTVSGDAEALRSLLRNLIDNALKYGGPEPTVHVSTTLDGGEALLRVDDAGPGIPEAERERVFDRFYRREPGRGSGSGLGLAIVRAVARAHGGGVRLASSPLGGLRVEVRVPAA